MIKKRFVRTLLIYFAGTLVIIATYRIILAFAAQFRATNSLTATLLLHIVIILSIALIIIGLRLLSNRLIGRLVTFRRETTSDCLQNIRSKVEECTSGTDLGKCLLEEVHKLFNVHDAQLTLYYDLPIGLEVTHIRRTGEVMILEVKRVREDEFEGEVEDPRFLSPQDAHVSEIMTHRDRLVGLLLLGSKDADSSNLKINRELLSEFITIISTALDQLMMMRRVSETNQKLFENEKLISIGQLASGIAHEIRNPLSSLQINLQGLSKVDALSIRDVSCGCVIRL